MQWSLSENTDLGAGGGVLLGDPSIRPDCGAAVSKDGDVGATNSVDDGVSTNLGDVEVVVVGGAARDAARACSTRITSRRPLAFCIEF